MKGSRRKCVRPFNTFSNTCSMSKTNLACRVSPPPHSQGSLLVLLSMVGHLFHNYGTIYVRFSPLYLQSFLLHDIRAFFCHVYLRFIPKYMTIFLQTRIYMRTKKPIYMRYKQACGIWGQRKSSYKRHRIIPSAKNPFMYDEAEK